VLLLLLLPLLLLLVFLVISGFDDCAKQFHAVTSLSQIKH
jgi:hypothetical protein